MRFKNLITDRKDLVSIILLIVVIKLFLFCLPLFTFDFTSHPDEQLIKLWDRWDAGVYKSIAQHAYTKTENMPEDYWAFKSHFPPLYPALIRLLTLVMLPPAYAGITISFIASIAASIYLYRLVLAELNNPQAAFLSAVFMAVFPTSYFTNSIYSESLFLFCSIASFYYLRKKNFLLSALLAGGAVLTRLVGVVFIPLYLLFAAFDYYEKRRFKWEYIYLWVIPAIAVISFMLVNKIYYGHPLFFLKDTISFNTTKQLIVPFKETYTDILAITQKDQWRNQEFMMARGWNALFALFAVIFTTLGVKKMPWEYTLFSYLSILVFASLSWGISNARYVFAVFPLFIVLGNMNNKFIQGIFLSLSFSGLLYFTKIFTTGGWGF